MRKTKKKKSKEALKRFIHNPHRSCTNLLKAELSLQLLRLHYLLLSSWSIPLYPTRNCLTVCRLSVLLFLLFIFFSIFFFFIIIILDSSAPAPSAEAPSSSRSSPEDSPRAFKAPQFTVASANVLLGLALLHTAPGAPALTAPPSLPHRPPPLPIPSPSGGLRLSQTCPTYLEQPPT